MRAPWSSRVPLVLLLLLLQAAGCTNAYKPVIIVHGILDGPKQFENLSTFIKKAHPGTKVQTVSLYNNMESLKPLWLQVEDFRKAIEDIMNKSPEGVHLLCFSQATCDRVEMRAPWSSRVPLVLLLLLQAAGCTNAYKPVIIVHGILDGPKQFENLSTFIKKAHPGTKVQTVSLYNNMESLKPLWLQVEDFRKAIEDIMNKSPEGVHLLCFSQGGLICRAVLSTSPNHNVHTFISLSSPLAGQYGDTDYLKKVFPDHAKKMVYIFCYNKMGQKISICDYWNDPHHRADYLRANTFLPLINGEKSHKYMKDWRENFLRIKKMVMIGGPDDGVITPWQSSHYGFYNASEDVVEMRNQEFYKHDAFGLKTLDARGDVSVCVQSGVEHTQWHSNITAFTNCIEKWLI